MLENLIISKNTSFETRTALTGALLQDNPVRIWRSSTQELPQFAALLAQENTLAMGEIDFMEHAMNLAGKAIPANLSYPESLLPFLKRRIQSISQGEFIAAKYKAAFIKPQKPKLFTGFVFHHNTSDYHGDEVLLGQHHKFLGLPSDELLWLSEVVDIEQEWRIYVQDRQIVGYARYDDSPASDYAGIAQDRTVAAMIAACDLPHPYTLDIGINANAVLLIECNDAWAIGLYKPAMKPQQYLDFLMQRWKMLT